MNAISGYDFVKTIISRHKENPIEKLLEHAGDAECDFLELKATVDVKAEHCKGNEKPSDIYWNIARELIAMINSRGGILIIGVSDEAEHPVVPLEEHDQGDVIKNEGLEAYCRRAIEARVVPDRLTWNYRDREFKVDRNIADYLERRCLNYQGHTIFAYLVRPCEKGDFISVRTTYVSDCGNKRQGPEELYRRVKGNIGECECLNSYADFRTHLENREIESELLAAEINRLDESSTPAILNTLPVRNRDFVGREEELAQLYVLIEQGRIPILHGEGGAGKTELACEFAHRNLSKFGGGCLFLNMQGIVHWADTANAIYAHPRVRDMLGPIPSDVDRKAWIFEKILANLSRGNMLVVLDNLDDAAVLAYNELHSHLGDHIEGRRNRICILATSRKADAKTFPQNGHEIAVVYKVEDLKPDAAADLLCSRLPDEIRKTEESRKAATEIVQLLGCHAWSTEITGGYLSQNYEAYGHNPLGALLDEMKRKGRELHGGPTPFRKNGNSPEALFQPTIARFKELGTDGRNAIRLAECISKFPSTGVTEGPLAYFWTHLLPNRNIDEGFRKALKLLDCYAIISTRRVDGRIRMHQSTQEYFRSRRSYTPQAISKALSKDPNCPIRFWAELARDNQLMVSCPWDRLPGIVCRDIVLANPDAFAAKIRWNKLDGYALADILSVRPDLARHVRNFEPLYDNDPECPCRAFALLLSEQPEPFASRCDFTRLNCRDIVRILSKAPQLLLKCRKAIQSFAAHEWAAILLRQPAILNDAPDLAKICPWGEFSLDDWAKLISHQPQFVGHEEFTARYSLRDFTPFSWAILVARQRDAFLRHPDCPLSRIANDRDAIVALLERDPGILTQRKEDGSPLIPFNLNLLDSASWVRILSMQPQLQDLCTRQGAWQSFSGDNWADLLSACPQFFEKCDTTKLNGNNWAQILDKHPEFEAKSSWESISREPQGEFLAPIVRILYNNPEFADRKNDLDITTLSPTGKRLLLSRIPSLREKVAVKDLPAHERARLIMADPAYAKDCDAMFAGIDPVELAVILVIHPKLEAKINRVPTLTRNLIRDGNRAQAIYDLLWDIDEARMTCNAAKLISAAAALSWIYFTHGLKAPAKRYADLVRSCQVKYGDPPNRKPLHVNVSLAFLLKNVSTMVDLNDASDKDLPNKTATIFILRLNGGNGAFAKSIPAIRNAVRQSRRHIDIIDSAPGDRKFETRLSAARKRGCVTLAVFQEGLPDYLPNGKLKHALQAFHMRQSGLSQDHLKELGFDQLITIPPMLLSAVPPSCGKAFLNAALMTPQVE